MHSLHHKSRNPGPWSGLAMHPVEHLLYYTCTLLCLLYKAHPLHFLYAKVRAPPFARDSNAEGRTTFFAS